MTRNDSTLIFVGETNLPTIHGILSVKAFRNTTTGQEPIAIVCGEVTETPIVRVHDACFTSEVLGSVKCDCKAQLDHAIETIQAKGGIVVYLHQEGRGIGLANKIAAYGLQELGFDTVDANRHLHLPDDAREYQDAVDILSHLGVHSLKLLTNNPRKVERLTELGVNVVERIPSEVASSIESMPYIHTKIKRMGHLIDLNSLPKTTTD